MAAPESLVFAGYRDIVENFWGLDDYPVPENDWADLPLLFVDPDDSACLFVYEGGCNEIEVDVIFADTSLRAYYLNGEGGFEALLFDARAYDILKAAGAAFISKG